MKKFFVLVLVVLMAGVCSCAGATTIDGHFGNGTVGEAYEGYFKVIGFYNVDASISGSIPPGLSWKREETSNGSVIYLRGTPTTAGDYTFNIFINRNLDVNAAKYTIHIYPAPDPGHNDDGWCGFNAGFGLPGLMLAVLLFRKSRR